tara:strand:- start:353 stop:658 length:306 start_codon:yes stop_codon:yes gene_type:complete
MCRLIFQKKEITIATKILIAKERNTCLNKSNESKQDCKQSIPEYKEIAEKNKGNILSFLRCKYMLLIHPILLRKATKNTGNKQELIIITKTKLLKQFACFS